MKFEEMYIKASKDQKPKVYAVLEKLGFAKNGVVGSSDDYVTTYENGMYCDFSSTCVGYPVYSYDDFMKKYDSCEMIELINKAKSKHKMNDSELSLALGKSRQYIGKMLRLPQSKKVQDKVIKEIGEFMDKVKNQVIEKEIDISGVFIPNKIQDVIVGQANELDEKDKQISDLKKANEQQKLVIDKLDDQLIKAEKIHNEDVKAIEAKDKTNADLEENLEQSKRETDYFVNQFKRVEDELKELKSSHTTSKALNWFFVVAIILAAIIWKSYNG